MYDCTLRARTGDAKSAPAAVCALIAGNRHSQMKLSLSERNAIFPGGTGRCGGGVVRYLPWMRIANAPMEQQVHERRMSDRTSWLAPQPPLRCVRRVRGGVDGTFALRR